MYLALRRSGLFFATLSAILFPLPVGALSPAPGVDGGAAVVVDAVNTNRVLDEFDSTTAFRLRLPQGASCPGDSANDDYRVQTFLVPGDTDLSTLKYRNRSPNGNELYRALRFIDGEVSTQVMTEQNTVKGQPALILEARAPFTFAFYREGSLPSGRWQIGVACTPVPGWNVEKFWSAEIVLADAPEVQPGGLRISVVPDEPATGDSRSGGAPTSLILVGVGALVLVSAAGVLRRRRSSAASNISSNISTPTKEYQ